MLRTPLGLRTQAAALFVVLAILMSGLLTVIALGYRATIDSQKEQEALLTWQYASAQIDATALTTINQVYQWNNAMVAGDLPAATHQQEMIATDSVTIARLLAQISSLQLPNDAAPTRTAQSDAALAVSTFANKFIAAGVHPDIELQIAGGAALKAWRDALVPLDPFITAELQDNHVIEATRTSLVFNVMRIGGVVFLVALFLLGWLQFRLTLRPIANLARVAHSLSGESRRRSRAPSGTMRSGS